MKKLGKLLLQLLLVFIILVGVGAGSYFGYQWYQRYQMEQNRPKLAKAKDGTNINAAWFDEKNYRQQLQKKYPFINKVANYVPPRTWTGKDAIIPGLETTKSYSFKQKKLSIADKMTPQGLTVADKYLLITAYDGDHEHASVIYVLDKATGKYLKTVQIKGRPHLGGIAYDPIAKNIWITGSMGKASALMAFSLKTLKRYHGHMPIEYIHQISIPSLERASALTYYDDQLFVGLFNMYGRGKVASYNISRSGPHNGSITNNEIKSVTGNVSWSDPSGQTSMDKQIQGIAIYDNKIFLSQSYGGQDSKLYVFPITALNELDEKNAELVIDLPPYLEQITAYKGQLLCIFESASNQYARPDIMVMDRVLSLNINALFGY